MKGWDKESLRHSAARKFGKAPPYRSKGIKEKIIEKIKEPIIRKKMIKDIKVGDFISYKPDWFYRNAMGYPEIMTAKVEKIKKDWAGTSFSVYMPFRQLKPSTGETKEITGQTSLVNISEDDVIFPKTKRR